MFQDYKVAYARKHVKVREAQRLSFLRQAVAFVLSQSARKIPHAAMVTQVDVTPLVEYGRAHEEEAAAAKDEAAEKTLFRRAILKNFSAFFIKTIAHSLYHTPCMNGFLDYAPWLYGGTLYRAEDINLSFTVHTKYGVIKPIARNPHLKTLEQLAEEMRGLTRRARRTDPQELYIKALKEYVKEGLRQLDFRGLQAVWIYIRERYFRGIQFEPELRDVPEEDKLQVSDILGATCTVANIGMMVPGNQTVTVIIPPEVMMFGIGDLHIAPRCINGKIVPRSVITITATMDHRAFDAGEAFPFAKHFMRYVDNPALIYEWKPGDPI